MQEITHEIPYELAEWNKLFGEETAWALWQAHLAGHTDIIKNIDFWEQRIRDHGLPGDYFGFQYILGCYFAKAHARKRVEIIDALLVHYGDSKSWKVQVQCATALLTKGLTLTIHWVDLYRQGWTNKFPGPDWQDEINVYDLLLSRYAASDNPDIQEQCATALCRKGLILGQCLDDRHGAVDVYNALLARYRNSESLEIKKLCATALFYEGWTQERMGHFPVAIACYDELLARYSKIDNFDNQAQCQHALVSTAELSLVFGKRETAIQRLQQLLERVDEQDQDFAITRFLLWLSEAGTTPDEVLAAIRALSPKVEFTRDFSRILRLVETLPEPQKTQAEYFITFFKEHRAAGYFRQLIFPSRGPNHDFPLG